MENCEHYILGHLAKMPAPARPMAGVGIFAKFSAHTGNF
jgi:hypothetical protein